MFHQASANALPDPGRIRCELSEKQTGNGIGRLPSADYARQDRKDNSHRRKPVISNDTPGIIGDHNHREAFFLIGKGARFQPMIERQLATGELGNVMRGRERFRS